MHVWRAALGRPGDDDLLGLLSDEERTRAAHMLSARARVAWSNSRAVLRELLGRYLGRDGRDLRFDRDTRGKPFLTGAGAPSFNLSHSGGVALYAFACSGSLGIDVELGGRKMDETAIALRVFGPEVARRLSALDATARSGEFLRAWARHEATLKCHGDGLWESRHLAPVWTAHLDLDAGDTITGAAVAADPAPSELRCFEFDGPR